MLVSSTFRSVNTDSNMRLRVSLGGCQVDRVRSASSKHGADASQKSGEVVGLTARFGSSYHKWKEAPHNGLTSDRLVVGCGRGSETGDPIHPRRDLADRTIERTVDKMGAAGSCDWEGLEGCLARGCEVAYRDP